METIGFVGLGVMGKAMAANLVKAGYRVVVHNRSREAVDELARAGAEPASSPRAAAEGSDVVITMLPDSPDVEAVVLGQDGVAEGASEGMLLVEMSTIAPAISRRLHETLGQRGVDAIDAPVSGGQAGAESGELSIMVGGSDESVKRARPILEVLGGAVTHIGPPGAGQVAKAANQIIVALTIQAVSEALTLTRKAGVDPAKVREALLGGFAQSKVLEVHGARMLSGDFEPGFRLALHRKDLAIALETARDENVSLPATAQAAEMMNALLAAGRGDADSAVMSELYAVLAGMSDDGPAAAEGA